MSFTVVQPGQQVPGADDHAEGFTVHDMTGDTAGLIKFPGLLPRWHATVTIPLITGSF